MKGNEGKSRIKNLHFAAALMDFLKDTQRVETKGFHDLVQDLVASLEHAELRVNPETSVVLSPEEFSVRDEDGNDITITRGREIASDRGNPAGKAK